MPVQSLAMRQLENCIPHPSVADATSPETQGYRINPFLPGEAGEVAPSYGDGGVMSNATGAHDPSVTV